MSLQLGGFPLVVASRRGLLSAVRVLLVNGTDVNQRTQVSCLLYHTHFDTGSGGSEYRISRNISHTFSTIFPSLKRGCDLYS